MSGKLAGASITTDGGTTWRPLNASSEPSPPSPSRRRASRCCTRGMPTACCTSPATGIDLAAQPADGGGDQLDRALTVVRHQRAGAHRHRRRGSHPLGPEHEVATPVNDGLTDLRDVGGVLRQPRLGRDRVRLHLDRRTVRVARPWVHVDGIQHRARVERAGQHPGVPAPSQLRASGGRLHRPGDASADRVPHLVHRALRIDRPRRHLGHHGDALDGDHRRPGALAAVRHGPASSPSAPTSMAPSRPPTPGTAGQRATWAWPRAPRSGTTSRTPTLGSTTSPTRLRSTGSPWMYTSVAAQGGAPGGVLRSSNGGASWSLVTVPRLQQSHHDQTQPHPVRPAVAVLRDRPHGDDGRRRQRRRVPLHRRGRLLPAGRHAAAAPPVPAGVTHL